MFVEGGAADEQTRGGLWLAFRVGRRRVFPTLVSLLGLLLVELPELLVVPSRDGLELPVIELSKDAEPEGIRFILEKQVVRFNEFNQRQLVGRADDGSFPAHAGMNRLCFPLRSRGPIEAAVSRWFRPAITTCRSRGSR